VIILFVTKDRGGFQVTEPIAEVALHRGHEVMIATEGFSIPEWKKTRYNLVFVGTKNFEEEPFAFNAHELLQSHRPDLVVSTYGQTPNIERQTVEAAKNLGMPCVGIEDGWGGSRRINPDLFSLILAQEFGKSVIEELCPGIKTPIVETGSPFVSSMMKNPVPDESVRAFNAVAQGRKTMLVAGNDWDTQYFLHWALSAVARSGGPGKILPIVRMHPRTDGTEKDKECWMLQQKLFTALYGDNSIVTLADLDTVHIARLADITVSNYGTLFLASSVERKIPVRVASPVCDAEMLRVSKIPFYPLIRVGTKEIGAVLEFDWEHPTNLWRDVFPKRDRVIRAQEENVKFSPTAAEDAMNEIEKLMGEKQKK